MHIKPLAFNASAKPPVLATARIELTTEAGDSVTIDEREQRTLLPWSS
jgi:hypothetical protein